MLTIVEIAGKPLKVETSPRADRMLAQRQHPLHATMNLYFSCMVVKKVHFGETPDEASDGVAVSAALSIGFRAVMKPVCEFDEIREQPLQVLQLEKREAYVPRWVRIDYRSGQWTGEFGYRD